MAIRFAGNSSRTIHRGTIYRAQITAHNLPCTIHRAQFIAHNSLQHNPPRVIHHIKIKIPLDEFLILQD
jgi:hypothetical protein